MTLDFRVANVGPQVLVTSLSSNNHLWCTRFPQNTYIYTFMVSASPEVKKRLAQWHPHSLQKMVEFTSTTNYDKLIPWRTTGPLGWKNISHQLHFGEGLNFWANRHHFWLGRPWTRGLNPREALYRLSRESSARCNPGSYRCARCAWNNDLGLLQKWRRNKEIATLKQLLLSKTSNRWPVLQLKLNPSVLIAAGIRWLKE